MDRFQRYALIIGPIVGAILVFLILSAMADQVQQDQDTLGELGPVTLEEVAQNPSLVAEEDEGATEDETGDTAVEADTATTTTAEVDSTAAVTASAEVTGTEELTASEQITASEESTVETVTEDTDAEISETSIVTATDDVVIAASVTDTERILTSAIIAENVVWFLLQYADESGELTDVVEGSSVTALFDGTAISGSTGCSNYAGSFTADESGIFTVQLSAIAPAGTQPESCVDGGTLSIQESEYINALSRSATHFTDDSILEISDEEGTVILHFEVTESTE